MRFRGWQFWELSREDQAKIGFTLPMDWKFEGTPGDQIWPIFQCPFCNSDCVRVYGGCDHICYIYDEESRIYEYSNPAFVRLAESQIQKKYGIQLEVEENGGFVHPPKSVVKLDGNPLSLEAIFPELKTVEFVISLGSIQWKETAAFLKK